MTKRPVELVATVYGAIKQKPHSPAPRRDGGLEPVSHHGSLAQDLVLEDLLTTDNGLPDRCAKRRSRKGHPPPVVRRTVFGHSPPKPAPQVNDSAAVGLLPCPKRAQTKQHEPSFGGSSWHGRAGQRTHQLPDLPLG